MRLRFDGEVFYWRGPAPWHYIAATDRAAAEIAAIASAVTYAGAASR
ncbi:MAG: hypothetical protein QOE05_90 [Actinomycetota bacterium]|jgi:hypothetical protein|nr:hypothetical protein [Actinomycetota bacterium]